MDDRHDGDKDDATEIDDTTDPREQARNRRRDRDATASERSMMRTGLGKQFKQVLDAQARRGREAAAQLARQENSRQTKKQPKPSA